MNVSELKKEIQKFALVSTGSSKKAELQQILKNLQEYKRSIQNIKDEDYNSFTFVNSKKKITVNPEQFRVITSDIKHNIRIIACAGSGKTTTIVCRIKYLIDHGVHPERIMLTTFNVDAAETMKNKLTDLFGFFPSILIGTIDSIACRYYYRYVASNYIDQLVPNSKKTAKTTDPKNGEVIGVSEYCFKLAEFMEKNPTTITKHTDYLMFDEFQDCNKTQYDVFMQYCRAGTKICVIGDDAQNIYQWRGSNIDYILNLHKQIPDLVTHKLVYNYRSTPEIINFANASISYNSDQIPKNMLPTTKSINVQPHVQYFDSDSKQANRVIEQIVEFKKTMSLDQIVVMARNNKALKLIEENITKLNKKSTDQIKFVALLTDDLASTKPTIKPDHLTLTTIHKSKGLEWTVVFIVDCNDAIFPTEVDPVSIQEERRLFYVAITRAKQYLYLYFTSSKLSRFVGEVPKELYTTKDLNPECFHYTNSRRRTPEQGVAKLVQLLNEQDIDTLRKKEIIPKLITTEVKIHGEHKTDPVINKYYLNADFGEFVDRYTTRLIGSINRNSGGLQDRCAELVIFSVPLTVKEMAVYKKYAFNFVANLPLIEKFVLLEIENIKRPADRINAVVQMFKTTKIFKMVNILGNTATGNFLQTIQKPDHPYVSSIIMKFLINSMRVNRSVRQLIALPGNFLPDEFIDEMRDAYHKYVNHENKTNQVLEDIYRVSLCGNIINERKRLLYKNVYREFREGDEELFSDIRKFALRIKNNVLACKKYLHDERRQIIGEIDLLDVSSKMIIDYKCSQSSACQLEWILQVLSYVGLIRELDPTIPIENVQIYNPLMGTLTTMNVSKWNKHVELLDYLVFARNRQQERNSLMQTPKLVKFEPEGGKDESKETDADDSDSEDESDEEENEPKQKVTVPTNVPKLVRIEPQEPYYMVMDTETTGIPKRKKGGYPKYTDLAEYDCARLVQLSWAIYDKNMNFIKVADHTILPEGFIINNENIHGVSFEIANMVGEKVVDVLDIFANDLKLVTAIVGHNIEFDINIMLSEMTRVAKNELIAEFKKKSVVCTMELFEKYLKNARQSLANVYSVLFKKQITGAHNSKYDVLNTGLVFKHLLDNFINIKKT